MGVSIFINNGGSCRVIRRININTFHLSAITRLQQVQGLEIVGMDEQAVCGGVKAGEIF